MAQQIIARIIIIIHSHLIEGGNWGQERWHNVMAEPGLESRPPLTSRPAQLSRLPARVGDSKHGRLRAQPRQDEASLCS